MKNFLLIISKQKIMDMKYLQQKAIMLIIVVTVAIICVTVVMEYASVWMVVPIIANYNN